MAVDPKLLGAIRQAPANLQPILLATAIVESGGQLNRVGDSGHSGGPFQENDQGRGHGIPMQQRFDPVGSTQRATREFQAFAKRGFTGAELAYRAQRPADRASYIAKIQGALPQAQKLLGGAPAGGYGSDPAKGMQVSQSVTSLPALQNQGFEVDPVAEKIRKQAYAGLEAWRARAGKQALAGQIPDSIPRSLLRRYAAYAPKELTLPQSQTSTTMTTLGTGNYGDLPAKGTQAANAMSGKYVLPVSTKFTTNSEFAVPDREGAPGSGGKYHAAKDWFAPAGTAVVSPEAGKVVEVRPSRGTKGQVFGGTVKVQDAAGHVWVFRHVVPGKVAVGQSVAAGAPLATVSPWDGGRTHTHIEYWKTLGGGYNYGNMLDPVAVLRGQA